MLQYRVSRADSRRVEHDLPIGRVRHFPTEKPPGARRTGLLWMEGRIRISKSWVKGEDGETKTEASDGYVPMHPLLSERLEEWHQGSPYAKTTDFLFPSLKFDGKVPCGPPHS
jgi:hypothetical protein